MIQDSFITHLISKHSNPAFVDEVGLGSIFGPLVACAVLLPDTYFYQDGVNDSKKLKHEEIYRLAPILKRNVTYAFGILHSDELREIKNMFRANQQAIKRAIQNLPRKPDAAFIDGRYPLKNLPIPTYGVIKGDAKVFGIAVASIIAKNFRDHLVMARYGTRYARYDIKSNKGYRSPVHLRAIREWGATGHHRVWMPQIKRILSGSR